MELQGQNIGGVRWTHFYLTPPSINQDADVDVDFNADGPDTFCI
jgi:hypothetical protein